MKAKLELQHDDRVARRRSIEHLARLDEQHGAGAVGDLGRRLEESIDVVVVRHDDVIEVAEQRHLTGPLELARATVPVHEHGVAAADRRCVR